MIDLDEFAAACEVARKEERSALAVKDVLEEMVSRAKASGAPLVDDLGVKVLHRSADLTILHVTVPAGLPSTLPHNHQMWAAVGIYAGQEDNSFFRREGSGLAASGGRSLVPGDVLVMGDDTIHSIGNPRDHESLCALHVYGGDLLAASRSMWTRDPVEECPYDDRAVLGFGGFK